MRATRAAAVAGTALLLGVVASISDRWGSGLPPHQGWRVVSIVTNAGSVWAGVAVLAGWIVVRRGAAVLAGWAALVLAVAGYYAAGLLVGDRVDVGLAGVTGALRLWLVAAVVMGPVLGLVGHLARRRDLAGTLARMVVPTGVLAEVVGRFRLSTGDLSVDPVRGWTLVLMVAVAAASALGVLRAHAR